MKIEIKDYPGYFIEEDGTVWSHKHKVPKIISGNYNIQGYDFIYLCKNGIMKTLKAHRLVAEHFLSNPNNLPLVCHKVESKPLNNHKYNLFWGTSDDNIRDMEKKGRRAIGEKQGLSKLTEDEVRFIRQRTKSFDELAEMFGVSNANIQAVVYRRTWKHI